MARVNPALTIWVAREWVTHPEIQALADAGHTVRGMDTIATDGPPDLILHPAAHGWHDELFGGPYLKTALTAARKRHRERKKK